MYKALELQDTLNFGKHKGKKIIDVLKFDAQYLKFLVNKGFNFEEETRHKILCTITYSYRKKVLLNKGLFREFEKEECFDYENYDESDKDFTDDINYHDFMTVNFE